MSFRSFFLFHKDNPTPIPALFLPLLSFIYFFTLLQGQSHTHPSSFPPPIVPHKLIFLPPRTILAHTSSFQFFPFSPRKNTLTLPVLPDIIVLENSLRALVPTAMLWNSGRSFYDPGSCLETGWPSHFEKEATHTFADEVREIIWFFIVRCFKKTDIFLRTLHQFSHSARIRASILIFRRNQDEKKNNRIVTFS